MTREMEMLASIAVDQKTLATNFVDVIPDCCGVGADVKTELINFSPLYNYLINTSLARRVRAMIDGENGMCILHKSNDDYVIDIPGSYWSEPAQSTAEECCWQPFDFAKCASSVPVKRLCLKDCDNIDNELLGGLLRMNASYGDLARQGESLWETKKRIARISMAFLTMNNVILGTTAATTDILKPFHGLMEVMSNPAVVTVAGADILSAFDSLYCRMTLLGAGDYTFAVNPLIYESIRSVVRPGQFGELPSGWAMNGEEITFHGIGFIQDRHVPVNLTAGTGEVWALKGDAVGAWMATDLMPADPFIKESGHKEETLANGCGSSCTFYYNYGSVFNNNSNKLMRITGIPVSAACAASTGDLGALILPQTLIPNA